MQRRGPNRAPERGDVVSVRPDDRLCNADHGPQGAEADAVGEERKAYDPRFIAEFGPAAGVFLSQLFHWEGKGRDPDGWIYKTEAEWRDETGLVRNQQRQARKKLVEAGVVEQRIREGVPPKNYYRIDLARLAEVLGVNPEGPDPTVHAGADLLVDDNLSDDPQDLEGVEVPDVLVDEPAAATLNQKSVEADGHLNGSERSPLIETGGSLNDETDGGLNDKTGAYLNNEAGGQRIIHREPHRKTSLITAEEAAPQAAKPMGGKRMGNSPTSGKPWLDCERS